MADPAGKDDKKFKEASKKLGGTWEDISKELPAAAKLRKEMDGFEPDDEKKNAKIIGNIETKIADIRKLLKESDTGTKAVNKLV